MYFDQAGWWLIILLNIIGFYISRFGYISQGAKPEGAKILGGVITTISFILMFAVYGFINAILLLLLLWVAITPVVMILIKYTEKKLYPYSTEKMRRDAYQMGMSVEDIKSLSGKSYPEIWKALRLNNKININQSNENNSKSLGTKSAEVLNIAIKEKGTK